MAIGRSDKAWTLVLCCYACESRFTLRRLTFDKVSSVPLTVPCPYCSARPVVGPRNAGERLQVHTIVDLSDETHCYYRKSINRQTWHSTAECSHWPLDDFIELDSRPFAGELCSECRGVLEDFRKKPRSS